MIRHLADGNPLPIQVFDPAEAGPWKQEASQPPLYYYLGAALTFWIDASDMEQVRWLNPHVDNGVLTADGNINLAIHDPAANPWRGTLLAVRIVRLFSVLLGACTVYLTYRIGLEAMPERPEIAVGAAAVNAFTPMFLFISGAVNNDNLAIPLASLALLLMIGAVNKTRPSRRYWLLLGLVIGLALLTKEGTFALIPLAWGTAFISSSRDQLGAREQRSPAPDWVSASALLRVLLHSLLTFLLVMGPALLVAGWWYLRNVRLYGDWLGWSAFIAVLGQRAQPASLAQLWGERHGFMLSYWGLFGGVNVPMASWIYVALNGLLLLSLLGFALFALNALKRARASLPVNDFDPARLFVWLIKGVQKQFGLVLVLLFALAVIYGLIQWATTTWSSQGRLVFTAISALSLLFAIGLAGILPARASKITLGLVGLFMFLVSAAAPFAWIRPAYAAEHYFDQFDAELGPARVSYADPSSGANLIRLAGHEISIHSEDGRSLRPGAEIDVILEWDVLAPMETDWSIFVHLVDPVLRSPVAQRDMYPGQGLIPTSLMQPGGTSRTFMRLAVPQTAVAPAELALRVGWYDLATGVRLLADNATEGVMLDQLALLPHSGPFPNPTSVNFANEFELVGYELSKRRALPGELIELTLLWRALRNLRTDYTVFAQLVDDDTTRWASYDQAPPGGTAAWLVGDVHFMHLPLEISDRTPPGVYPIHLGAYTRTEDGDFDRLQIVSEDGRITQQNFLLLTVARVD
jgi:hypothetical protein